MFLKKLYDYNKLLFTGFVLFIVIQLFLNFKQGLTVIPFMHIGMYSGVQKIKTEISVVEVIVNDKQLQASEFKATTWDQIMLPLQAYYNQQKNGLSFYQNDIRRILAAFKIPSDEPAYFRALSQESFIEKYSEYLTRIINIPVKKIDIRQSTYRYLQVDNTARYLKVSSSNFFD